MQSIIGDEVWKPIRGLETEYEISNMGRIKSLARKGGNYHNKVDTILSLKDRVSIKLGDTSYSIDELVAEAFIKSLKEYDWVVHLDGDTHNNRVDNLQVIDTDTMGVDFKDVPTFHGYQASRDGVIRRKPSKLVNKLGNEMRLRCMVMKPRPDKDGYLHISVTINGRHMTPSVHKMVALTFIPNPENKPTVNHKDGNKRNNTVENLEWATVEEQNHHAIATGLRDGSMKAAWQMSKKLSSKSIYCVESNRIYPSYISAIRELGISYDVIRKSIVDAVSVKGYTFYRCDSDGNKIVDNFIKDNGSGKHCRCIETGQVFKSVREASREMNIDRHKLQKAIDFKIKINGEYSFEMIEV